MIWLGGFPADMFIRTSTYLVSWVSALFFKAETAVKLIEQMIRVGIFRFLIISLMAFFNLISALLSRHF